MGRKAKDITGQRFGRLVAIENTGEKLGARYIWLYKCDCGNLKSICSRNVTKGNTKSCGCLQKETGEKNGKLYGKGSLNKRINKNNTSGVKGVSFDTKTEQWVSRLFFEGNYVLNEYFSNKEDAINARKEAERKYFGTV